MSERTIYLADCSTGMARYFVDEGNVYDLNGQRRFYIDGEQVYSDATWQAQYYISDQHLYEHGTGRLAFYFATETSDETIIFDPFGDQSVPSSTSNEDKRRNRQGGR